MQSNGANLVRLATHLVGAYVANNRIPRSELPMLIGSVHNAFARLLNPAPQQMNGASTAFDRRGSKNGGGSRRR